MLCSEEWDSRGLEEYTIAVCDGWLALAKDSL
jgi:hypothetical protein